MDTIFGSQIKLDIEVKLENTNTTPNDFMNVM
jgi:hypothetical protein